jgi:hypothetical protein
MLNMSQESSLLEKELLVPTSWLKVIEICCGVTISALPVGEWLVRSDPKKEQRKMFNDPINSDTDLGIAVYQQVIMLPEGYLLVANLINEAMMTRMFSAEAQSIVDSFCYHYPYQILNAFNNDWDITANNLRHVLLNNFDIEIWLFWKDVYRA